MRRRDGVAHGDSYNLGWDWDYEWGGAPPEPMRGLWAKEADARLIAAAPELLEACRALTAAVARPNSDEWLDDVEAMAEATRAAIAKAEGR